MLTLPDLLPGWCDLAEPSEEGSYVRDQPVWFFHSGEMAATAELGRLDDGVGALCDVPQR